jgi:tetratricopeptide (TPR) repeat protein
MTKHIVLAALLGLSVTARAQPTPQPAPVDDNKKAEAKSLYEQGLSHYNLGEFDEAIKSFRAAYAIEPAPGLLFNIAQSFRLKKDYEQATYFYQTYLRLKPDAPNRADVEARLQEMQEALADQKKMEKAPPMGTLPPEGGATTTTTTTTTTTPTGTTGTTPVDKTPVDTETGPNQTLVTAGYATAGAGAALVITGLVFGSMAKGAESDLNKLSTNMGTWSQANQDKYDAGKRDNTIAVISFVAGGAAVVTGAALYFIGNMHKSSTSVAITPTPHGTAVAVGWSF